jgi:hypothetical protein
MAISNRGNKLFIYLSIYLFISYSCTKRSKNDDYVIKNFNEYSVIYNTLNDSLDYYSRNQLSDFFGLVYDKWQVDSLICINSSYNELFATCNVSSTYEKKAWSDEVKMILGKKINNQWYFFKGSTLVVPREMYGKDEHHPLSFHELSQIARKEMFGDNCLIKKDGKWIVNDKWVDYFFYNSGVCGHCKTKEQFDSAHWAAINKKWKHKIDTAEFKKQSGNYP